MKPQAKNLLVVDDEKVVCDSCACILSERGFSVQTTTDPSRGLQMATDNDYAVILLDIKMPVIDGLEFLEELKKKHKDVRVIMITGYPSTENAMAAGRLGAEDFVPKPFSPDELLEAVTKLVPDEEPSVGPATTQTTETKAYETTAPDITTPAVEPERAAADEARVAEYSSEYYFLDEAWVQRDIYGMARVGAFISSDESGAIISLQLPKVGDRVQRGLPLASFTVEGRAQHIVPSPVTGEVIEINEALAGAKPGTWRNPCREGWIARIRPRNLGEELEACNTRRVILAVADEKVGQEWISELTDLGCTVELTRSLGGTFEAVKRSKACLLTMDATSFGREGPELVKYINNLLPEVKIVVIGDSDSRWEADYRANKILYYAMKPLVNSEVINVLDSVFGPTIEPAPEVAPSRKLPNWISKVNITSRDSKDVNLLISGETLFSHKGVGLQLRNLIFSKKYPITFTLGAKRLNVVDIIKEIDDCDRLLLLEARDIGKIPGTVHITPGCELVKGIGGNEHKIKTMTIQPSTKEKDRLVFDARISKALAEFILREMTSD